MWDNFTVPLPRTPRIIWIILYQFNFHIGSSICMLDEQLLLDMIPHTVYLQSTPNKEINK